MAPIHSTDVKHGRRKSHSLSRFLIPVRSGRPSLSRKTSLRRKPETRGHRNVLQCSNRWSCLASSLFHLPAHQGQTGRFWKRHACKRQANRFCVWWRDAIWHAKHPHLRLFEWGEQVVYENRRGGHYRRNYIPETNLIMYFDMESTKKRLPANRHQVFDMGVRLDCCDPPFKTSEQKNLVLHTIWSRHHGRTVCLQTLAGQSLAECPRLSFSDRHHLQ